jgi:hypothetical protein
MVEKVNHQAVAYLMEYNHNIVTGIELKNDRMQRMRSEAGMVKETIRENAGADEAIPYEGIAIIGDAIYAGLCEIAGAIKELAKAQMGDEGEPVESDTYLDGSRK